MYKRLNVALTVSMDAKVLPLAGPKVSFFIAGKSMYSLQALCQLRSHLWQYLRHYKTSGTEKYFAPLNSLQAHKLLRHLSDFR